MKKKKLLFLLLFAIIGCSAVFMGCNTERIIIPEGEHDAAGYHMVRMYYNGGEEGGNSDMIYYVDKGGRIQQPNTALYSEIALPSRLGYELDGWYEINLDKLESREELLFDVYEENGEIIEKPIINVKNKQAQQTVYFVAGHDFTNNKLDEPQTELSKSDFENEWSAGFSGDRVFAKNRPWNFDFDKVEKDTCLVAIWKPLRYFVIVPKENINDSFDEIGYNKLPLLSIDASGSILKPNPSQLPVKKGYQIEGYYRDKDRKIAIDFGAENKWNPGGVEYTADGRFKVVPIFTDWLDEKYTIVTEASQLSSISTNGNYYIKNHLDFTGITMTMPDVYSGEIAGNGKVWRNLTRVTEQTEPRGGGKDIYGGVFKDLRGAKISRVTIENLSVVFVRMNNSTDWSRAVEINLFARSVDERTKLDSVVIGSASTASTYTMIESITSISPFFNKPRLDNNGNTIRYIDAEEAYANADGTWPLDDSAYQKDNLGRIIIATESIKDEDGGILYGYRYVELPDNAFTPIFVENLLNSDAENVVDCACYMTEDPVAVDWLYSYGPDIVAPKPLANVKETGSTYTFAGWFYAVEMEVQTTTGIITYVTYVMQDLTEEITEDRELIAMWKN